ncbi:RPM1 interacting protein 13 [Striga hermonthica]|uniref:RPM1 interacting protein 13 n=1 Tax=Striga hermonthica TaxID=68872 RepID=A0A9N7RCG2_STRHE|nr:RPM1 interacting protein 13 [Striga hermonthica]
MENSGPVVLDISSDEEADFGGASKGGGFGGRGFLDRDDCEWLSEILCEVGGNNKGDDSDDVVLIGETFQNPPKKSRWDPLRPCGKFAGGGGGGAAADDDDCVVLEGDPDKPVAVAAPAQTANGVKGDGDDGDDVEIVAEKGEVACRDFPHARHLCAKFLFASTVHEIHCSQCHCYVCDSVAPCPHWGTGASSVDHCHATDKDDYWRAERKRTKNALNPAPTVPHLTNTGPAGPIFAQIWAPPRPVPTRVPTMPSGFSRPVAVPVHQVRPHVAPVYRPQPPSALRQNPILRQPPSAAAPVLPPLGSHRPRNDPMAGIKKILKERRRMPVAPSVHRTTCQRSPGTHFSNSRPVNVGLVSCSPSQNPVVSSLMTCQPGFGNKFDNPNFPKTHVLQPCANNISVYAANKNVPGSRFVSPTNQSAGNNFSQPQQVPFVAPFGSQQVSQALNSINSSLSDLNSQVLQQWQSVWPAAADSNKCQGVVEDSSQIKGPVDNFQQGSVLADNSCFPESTINYDVLDLQFDDWMFENESLQGAMEAPVSPLWNALSPEPTSLVDTGNLFDI